MNRCSLATGLLCMGMLGSAANSPNRAWCLSKQNANATQEPILYFPMDLQSKFTNYFSQFLNLAHEPSLLAEAGEQKNEVYRVEWMSGQHGTMIAARITVGAEGGGTIVAKKQFGMPTVIREKQRTLSQKETREFLALVEKTKFWTLPVAVENPKNAGKHEKNKDQRTAYEMDASPWIFEGSRNGHYNAVGHETNKTKAIRDVVNFLLKEGNSLTQE